MLDKITNTIGVSLFQNVTDVGNSIDFTFLFIFVVCVFFLIANTAVMLYFCYKFSHKRNPIGTNIEGNTTIEVIWTVIPTILVMMMFYYGLAYNKMDQVPDGALKIKVQAYKWAWAFEYPNKKKLKKQEVGSPEWKIRMPILKIPVGRAIEFEMESTDVVHSLYIPAFRVKKDVLPFIKTGLWFKANKVGFYDLFCTEYCGDSHSRMYTQVEVVTQEEFDKWYNTKDKNQALTGDALVKKGRQTFSTCAACHSIDGSRIVGPSLKGLFTRETHFENGKSQKVDEAYVRKSILEPKTDVVKGFPNIMTKVPLDKQELDAIIAYLKTL
ncbi:MAG: cytochrome c oxidase subunit II [Candidatus Cloacimonadota bacterium]|nr:MAG: cytochrome c oxidase subunit II [Candidatus Cloacimonadota bacterium]